MVQRLTGEGINHAGIKRIIELESAMANLALEVAQLRLEMDALLEVTPLKNPPQKIRGKKSPEVILYKEEI